MRLTSVVDDGAVVYLNGQEVLRLGMPEGDIQYATLANRDVDEADFEGAFTISSQLLRPGENVLAVEVHQTRLDSTDIVFGLVLDARVNMDVSSGSAYHVLWDDLRVTELMYNPIGGNNFEFVELYNAGARPLELAGVRLLEGIEFTFPPYTLEPNQYVVVAENVPEFQSRYGMGIPVAGQYNGNLSNGGELLRLQLPEPHPANILNFEFDDQWLPETDGGGFSLVIDEPQGDRRSWSQASAWRKSNFVSGSPGSADAGLDARVVVINEVLAHTNQLPGDQIELHNTTGGVLNLDGWYLSNEAANLTKYRISEGTAIPAGGYVVLGQQTHFGGAFSLDDLGGQVHLASPDAVGDVAGYHETATYGAADLEGTLGRYVQSDNNSVDFVVQVANTWVPGTPVPWLARS